MKQSIGLSNIASFGGWVSFSNGWGLCRENLDAVEMKAVEMKAGKKAEYEARQNGKIFEEMKTEDPELSLINMKKPCVLGLPDRMVDMVN